MGLKIGQNSLELKNKQPEKEQHHFIIKSRYDYNKYIAMYRAEISAQLHDAMQSIHKNELANGVEAINIALGAAKQLFYLKKYLQQNGDLK